MTTPTKAPNTKKTKRRMASAEGPSASPGADQETIPISPAERWLLITENAHSRAQKRGFVGGDPFEDLLEAEQEIDARYTTDYEAVFALTDPDELEEQLKSVFAGYGCGGSFLDGLLSMHRDGLEKLAASNRKLVSTTSELANRQTALLQDAAADAVETLKSFASNWAPAAGVARQAELSKQAMENVMSHFNALTSLAADMAGGPQKTAKAEPAPEKELPDQGIRAAFGKAYEGKTLMELAEAPVTALKGISKGHAKKLKEAFGIDSIRGMATDRLAEWARGIVMLADAQEGQEEQEGQSPAAMADAPLQSLPGVSEQQAELVAEAFRIRTVRDLANNRFFRVARGIVMLADTERRLRAHTAP